MQLLRQTMDSAAEAGLTVLRMWTHGVTPGYRLQTKPGVYNEAIFRGLDYVLDEARKRNLKVSTRPMFSCRIFMLISFCLLWLRSRHGHSSAGHSYGNEHDCIDAALILWQCLCTMESCSRSFSWEHNCHSLSGHGACLVPKETQGFTHT
jgi:hypothetical protein